MFSLIDECGEINFVEFNIDTESPPIKQASHRAPYAVQQEIAAQVSKMRRKTALKEFVGKPVVSERKRDGSFRIL